MTGEQPTPSTRIPTVMDDPGTRRISKIYAEAFVNAGRAAGVDNALEEFQSFLDDVLNRQPEFAAVLCSTHGNRDDKLRLIDRIVAPFASELFANFLRVLARKDRLSLLPLILQESILRNEILQGKQRVQVTTATDLSPAQREQVRQSLQAKLPFEPIIEAQTDPTLIGGMVIRVKDTIYDSSVKSQMKLLRERLRQRSLHEIQSGRDRFSHPEGN
ncbi:MAG TPA: ATP synthase F1 subunit delta [Planctomycetaceae bacterium]|nr:ATP synthase F1 subunit delta [Planctomycetaceae bacterium]